MDEYNDREARFLAPYKRQDLANAIRNNKTEEAIKIIEENNNQKNIKHKFDLNSAVKGGDTLLGLATQYKNNDIINLLLDSGASVNKADIFDKTPDLYIKETDTEMKNKLKYRKAKEEYSKAKEENSKLELQNNELNKNDNSNIFLAILTLLTTVGTGVAIAAFTGGKRFSKNKAIKRMKRMRTRRMRTRRIKATKGRGKPRNLRK